MGIQLNNVSDHLIFAQKHQCSQSPICNSPSLDDLPSNLKSQIALFCNSENNNKLQSSSQRQQPPLLQSPSQQAKSLEDNNGSNIAFNDSNRDQQQQQLNAPASTGNTAENNLKSTTTYLFLKKWGSNGTEDGQFGSSVDIVVDSLGNVYVADSFNDSTQIYLPS
jgi:hypothetical protein